MSEMPSRHLPAATSRGLRLVPAHAAEAPAHAARAPAHAARAPAHAARAPARAAENPAYGDPSLCGAKWARQYRWRLQLSDSLIVVTVVLATFAIGMRWTSPDLARANPLDAVVVPGVIAVGWLLALAAYHTRDARVVGLGVGEYKLVVNASAIAFGMLAILFLLLRVDSVGEYFLVALPVGVVALVLDRWLWRKWLLRQRAFGHYLARAIVVGRRDDVEYVVAQIAENSGAAYRVVGAAIDGAPGSAITVGDQRIPIVARPDGVAAAAASVSADAVIVAGQPDEGGEFVRQLGWDLERTPAELVLSSRLTDVAGPRIHFRPVDGLPLIHVETPTFEGGKHILKRSVDILLSAIALVVLMPVMVVIGVLVKLDSPGPALFRQRRCSRYGHTFQMLKFRSMVENAEDDLGSLLDRNEASGVLFKLRNDPRVTRVGRWLRKYSLDELPQLWNVLVGDMSIVGPRPPLVTEVADYEGSVYRRLFIKPGMTGLWQISGRSDLSWEESVRLDLYYVENWSLTGDLMIMWRTAKAVVNPKGAY
jgi:exopolysaccharide biosynthesis polyprenyl glycosylphosphotransferase